MKALDLMRRAGWTESRKVPVDQHIEALRRGGFHAWEDLGSMLEPIVGLQISDILGRFTMWLDPTQAAATADLDWVTDYEHAAGVMLTPVGEYSHMLMMLGSDSAFYGGFDREFGRLGGTLEEAVNGVLVRQPPVRLSIRIA